jgi:hypothetical protein
LSNTEKELSYIKIHEEDYIKNLVNIVTVNNEDQYDDLSDDIDLYDKGESDADFTPQDPSAISQLDIEGTVDLLPWVVIDPTFIPQCTRIFNESDDDDESDFDVTDLIAKE